VSANLPPAPGGRREVVVGRNSKVWRASVRNVAVARRFEQSIGHAEVEHFRFEPGDRVWVFAYSRKPAENSRLLAALEAAGARDVVYVSTATTNVTQLTGCYAYPRVKRLAEEEARRRFGARVLALGLVMDSLAQAPPGRHAITLQSRVDQFLLEPHWPLEEGRRMHLFEPVTVQFSRAWERRVHYLYDRMQWALRRAPCLLRPIDLLLRAAGIRWYGYVNLSDRLWFTTTSSSARA
jgi:hypothetical protein